MEQQLLDELYMREALKEARKAADLDEVPVGAVIVAQGKIVGRGFNLKENEHDCTLHAEMIAIRNACANMGGWRLPGATLYVTLEPCPMCAGAMIQARIQRLVYATKDPKSGAAGSVLSFLEHPKLNHHIPCECGVLADEASSLLKEFFHKKRLSKNK